MMLSILNDFRALEHEISNRIAGQLNGSSEGILLGHKQEKILADVVKNDGSGYALLANQYQLNAGERLVVLLSILPHMLPHYYSTLGHAYKICGKVASEGELKSLVWNGDLPTVELFLFVMANFDFISRANASEIFKPDSKLQQAQLIMLKSDSSNSSVLKMGVAPTQLLLDKIMGTESEGPQFGADFPAKKVKSKLNWENLILETKTRQQLDDIISWQHNKKVILGHWGLSRIIKPGYRALFYGPPGTGKTMSASLIGQELGIDVYRIDLSMIVSKYIGETEKNLDKLFNRAEKENWILFFDEADALFGKRTNVSDAHDKYANQETSYLLQRIEDFDGIVILASNFKHNIDDAFSRRFQSIIEFKLPNSEEREMLWKSMLPAILKHAEGVDLRRVAQKFELSGGSILNVVQHVALKTAQRGDMTIRLDDITTGVKAEYYKQGRHLKV